MFQINPFSCNFNMQILKRFSIHLEKMWVYLGLLGIHQKLVRRVCGFCDGGLHLGFEQNQGPWR